MQGVHAAPPFGITGCEACTSRPIEALVPVLLLPEVSLCVEGCGSENPGSGGSAPL